MATTAGVWGWTLAGVWDRFGLLLVPGGVFLPVGVLEAAAGTRGDRGRLLGAAGDGGLFLGFGVLVRKRQVRQERIPQQVEGFQAHYRNPKPGTWSPVWISALWRWAT